MAISVEYVEGLKRMTNFPPKLFTPLPVFGQTNELRQALLTKVNNTKRGRNDTYLYQFDHVRNS